MQDTNFKVKILVIDDDMNLNTVLVDKLNVSGFEAQGAPNGEDGLLKAYSFHPNVILLDLVMPGMDGFQVLKKLREDQWGKDVKVIMLTLIDRIDSVAQAMESNVSGYLVKTNYSLDDMIKELNTILKRPTK